MSGRLLGGSPSEPNPAGRMSGIFLPPLLIMVMTVSQLSQQPGREGGAPGSPSENLLPPLVPPSKGAAVSSCLCSHEVFL